MNKINKIHKTRMNKKIKNKKKDKLKMQGSRNKWVLTRKLRKNFKWLSIKLRILMIPLLILIECSKEKLNSWEIKIISFLIKLVKPQWINISIWIFWPRYIKQELNYSKLRIDTTECLLNCRTNWMKNNQSATKFDSLSKTWRKKSPEKQLTVDLINPSKAIRFKNGKKDKLKLQNNYKIWDLKF